MMDAHDTNQPLNQGELEEEKKTVEVSEAITETPTEEVTAEVQTEAAPKPATKEDVLNLLKELAQNAENANKQDIDNPKQSFYKLHNDELKAAKKRNALSLIEVKCAIGAREDLGRPTTTAMENKVNFMEYLKTR